MSRTRKLILALFVVFILIQFIRPARNESGQLLPTDFSRVYTLPGNVSAVLQHACYDCHSNHTHYRWYASIQPIGWFMARHIKDGKAALNFSEFGSYSMRRRRAKLKSIAGQINNNDMPLYLYSMMHKSAKLASDQKRLVIDWTNKTIDSLSLHY